MNYDLRSLCHYPNGMSPLVGLLKLMNPPQQVTSRYVRNLLVKGSNNEFTITALTRLFHAVDTIIVGHYFEIEIIATNDQKKSAAGVTPEQAVHRCLEKHGVTFR